VYRGGGTSQLQESLSYNSRLLSEISLVWNGAYGKGWKGNYERQITLYGAVVVMKRADGREIDFRPPSSGNVYVSDDDIADRLERLTDGSGNTTGWKYVAAADDSTELYGATGKLLSISDRAGAGVTLTYSDSSTSPSVAPVPGLLITVTDTWGRSLGYVYNSQKRIVQMTDPAGGSYAFAYDSAGNLASITFPDTKVRQYLYNEQAHTQSTALPHSLTGIIDENGARFATYEYDTQGRAVSTEHAGGAGKVTCPQ
jgi:YD repeat-containing protein